MNRRHKSGKHSGSSYELAKGESPAHLEDRRKGSDHRHFSHRIRMMLPTRQLYRVGIVCIALFFTYGVIIQLGIQDRWSSPSRKLSPDGRPLVKLRQGSYIGEALKFGALRDPVEHFLGIPYALSPNGTRRYKPAEKVLSSRATFQANDFGLRCPSNGGWGNEGEDCLVADIVRPTKNVGRTKLPVLIYVHGGSFYSGSSRERQMANMMTWSERPFVAVSFNYRLGALGFLPSPSLAKEGNLNLGLKDQALFLEWIQENIAAFGGDPHDVTLMGSSAGAHSLGHHLMSSNGKKRLFHKIIIESGGPTARAVFPYDGALPQQQYQEFLKELDLASIPEAEVVEKLRSLSKDSIMKAANKLWDRYNPSVRWPFQPTIDGPGGFIPKAPIQAWRDGEWHKIPIMTGFNTDEGAMFVPQKMEKSEEFDKFFQTLLPNFQKADMDRLKVVYPDPSQIGLSAYKETRPGLGAQAKRVIAAYGQWAYIAPVRHTAHFASQPPSSPPVYLWHFAVNMSVNGGANHADHSRFVTYIEEATKKSPAAEKISGTMHAYFTSFITTGDPNTVKGRFPDRPQWIPYEAKGGKKMIFGEGSDEFAGGKGLGTPAKLADDNWAEMECDFWWSKTDLSER